MNAPPEQIAFDFVRERRLDSGRAQLLIALQAAVAKMGLPAAAGACDARKQDLSDALNSREGRHVRIEWVLAIADAAPAEHQRAIVEAFNRTLGWEAKRAQPRSAQERLDELLDELRTEHGKSGARLAEKYK